MASVFYFFWYARYRNLFDNGLFEIYYSEFFSAQMAGNSYYVQQLSIYGGCCAFTACICTERYLDSAHIFIYIVAHS